MSRSRVLTVVLALGAAIVAFLPTLISGALR